MKLDKDVLIEVESDGQETLYRFPENDVFPEFAVFEGADGSLSIISDMQGKQPQSLAEVPDYDWYPAEFLGQF